MDDDRREISVCAFSLDTDCLLSEFFKCVQDYVPAEHRDSAIIEIDGEGQFDRKILVSFKRPETDLEMRDRKNRDTKYFCRSREFERKLYEFIRAEF